MDVLIAAGSLLVGSAVLLLAVAAPRPRPDDVRTRREPARGCIELIRGRDFFERVDRSG